MNLKITYRTVHKKDLAAIETLLVKNNLPASDIITNSIDFIVASTENKDIVGCIGVEKYEKDGLLRSFAVDEGYRNKQVGKELFNRLLSFSRQAGIETLHLLTTTAEKYFLANGFAFSRREDAPPAIKKTSEFSSLCPASSAYMKKDITDQVLCYYEDVQSVRKDAETNASFWSVAGKNLQFSWFDVPPQTSFTQHQHDSEQVTYILEGELFFRIENNVYKLTGGDSIVIPSGKDHAVWTENLAAKAVDAWSPLNKKFSSI